MRDNKPVTCYVWGIEFKSEMVGSSMRKQSIKYNMNTYGDYNEYQLFKTKEELIASL